MKILFDPSLCKTLRRKQNTQGLEETNEGVLQLDNNLVKTQAHTRNTNIPPVPLTD